MTNPLRMKLLFAVLLLGSGLLVADEPTREGIEFFETKIRPVLVKHCYRCHANEGQGVRGGLMVDSRQGLLDGGNSGAAIVPGDLDESQLWNAINHEDLRMPPDDQLSPAIIANFRTWILMGAPDPRETELQHVDTRLTADDIEAGRDHWAFRPPQAKAPPSFTNHAWPLTVIDRFVLAKIEQHDLVPAKDADPYALVRRLHFDLVGLPPSIDEISSFVDGWRTDREQAVAREVDRLLDSDAFGERWGRHWLDVARYAESSGKEVDATFPHAWRYRDYVIDSLNADKPYDLFVQEQLAGDLLPAATDEQWTEQLIATGFLALGPKTLTEQNPRQFRADLIDEQIDTTTRAMLGISVACARCHDHKFDPIPQTDYYALAGIFASTETYFGGIQNRRTRRASDLLILPSADPNPFDRSLSPHQRQQLGRRLVELRQDYQQARRSARMPNNNRAGTDVRRTFVSQALLEQQVAMLTAQLAAVDDHGEPLSFCMGVQPQQPPTNARVLVRGEINQPAQEVPRGFVQVIGPNPLPIASESSGRLELARWITSPDNPLAARVMVNRIWLHLLGTPIVAETDNFGTSGTPPTHPELLDWLALRFVESGWSVKSMIRELTNSRVYRLAAEFDRDRFERDPDNMYFARANPRRLEAEAIRDAMLMVSGQLDLDRRRASSVARYGQTVLGPDGAPPPFAGVMRGNGLIRPQPESAVAANYRSVYLPISRNSLPRSLSVFDFAEPTLLIGRREESNTSNQSLYLMNNPLVIRLSDAFASRLAASSSGPRELIETAFLAAYGRPATNTELRLSQEFFTATSRDRARTRRSAGNREALSQFCQALFAAAEFRYLN